MPDAQSPPPAAELDPTTLGEILLRLPPACALLRHARMTSTIEYAGEGAFPGQELYLDFLYDILTEDNRSIVDKWYGGPLAASGLASASVAEAVAPHRHSGAS